MPKFFGFLKSTSVAFWQKFMAGPQFDETFGRCPYEDDFWVKDRSRDLTPQLQLALPATVRAPPPPLTLRTNNLPPSDPKGAFTFEDFKVGTMCVIDGDPGDDPTGVVLWIAEVHSLHEDTDEVGIIYYDVKNPGKAEPVYNVIDPDKVSLVSLDVILVPSFKLTKKNTVPLKIRKKAFEISSARLQVSYQ